MLALKCQAQNYAWGRSAEESEVAQLAKANGNAIDEDKPFAELWMGTHPNCPSTVAVTGQSLADWVAAHPQALGDKVDRHFKGQLPFLFKVLSVGKALSIQSHPDKALAEKLRASHPHLYADDNHKPEMALAISGFVALCGFASLPELQETLRNVPELVVLVGEQHTAAVLALTEPDKTVLRAAFGAVMTADEEQVKQQCKALVQRLESAKSQGELSDRQALVLQLHEQYPDDVGVMSSHFLNIVRLDAGEAIYLSANEPHAYVAGELMEVMATSDNVLRAGLTPKFKHTDVLLESLTYEQGLPDVLRGTSSGPATTLYRPPFEEFELSKVSVAAGSSTILPPNEGPVILLVQNGSGSAGASSSGSSGGGSSIPELVNTAPLQRGSIFFVPAGTELHLTSSTSSEGPLTIWAAAVNGTFFALQGIRDAVPAAAAAHAHSVAAHAHA